MEQTIKDLVNVRGLSGLINLGNTCYMNSIIQCLFATDFLNYYLKMKKFKRDLKVGIFNIELDKKKKLLRLNPQLKLEHLVSHIKKNQKKLKSKYKNSLTYGFYQLFTVMWIENCKVEPKKFKHLVGLYCDKFAGFRQHDAEEFLYFILNRVHEETKTKAKLSDINLSQELCEYFMLRKTILNDIESATTPEDKEKFNNILRDTITNNYSNELHIASIEYWKKYIEVNHSIISDIFTGLFCSEICCETCKNKSCTFEPFNILELSLVKKSGEPLLTLKECLDEFCSEEKINYRCDYCSKSTQTQGEAIKKITIWRIPDKLIIQLKRFNTSNGNSSKNNSNIDFPLNDLSLESITTPQNIKKDTYDLYATVNHFGELNGGHYIAHCKSMINSKWYEFNDSTLVHIPEHEVDRVIKCQSVYVLFYQNTKY